MILAHPSSLTADESPLSLLRLRRADAETELRKSLVSSSMLALTFCVAVLMARALLFPPDKPPTIDLPTVIRLVNYPIPPPTPTVDLPPSAPSVVATGAIPLPVDDVLEDLVKDVVASAPIGQGRDSAGGVGTVPGAITGGAVQAPEVEPSPSEWVEELPDPVTRVKPEYPDIPRSAGMEGTVLVRVLVGLDGHVRRAEIERSSPMFDEAALAAMRQWTFTPARSNGKPVMAWVRIPVKFTLH